MSNHISDSELKKIEIQISIQKEYREKQERYAYYMLSLAASCIAGTVVLDKSLYDFNIKNVLFLIACLSWTISIFYGINFVKYIISSIFNNDVRLKADFNNTFAGKKMNTIEDKLEFERHYKKSIDKLLKKAVFFYNMQGYSLLAGVIIFIIHFMFSGLMSRIIL